MKETKISFVSAGLVLEGILATPRDRGRFPAVVVCHPHPLYGGSMDNNVVATLARTLTDSSFISLRFNFRGAGSSQGQFDNGIGEQRDVQAAISFAAASRQVHPQRIGLAGYSAGVAFAFPVALNDTRIKALVAVSPPLNMFNLNFLKSCTKPKLVIIGSKDNFTDVNQVLEFSQNLAEPKQCEVIEGADHFWWGYEALLAARVTAFFAQVL